MEVMDVNENTFMWETVVIYKPAVFKLIIHL
jgi:hypothetical protein